MKIILPLVAIVLLFAPAVLLVGCSSLTTRHVGEPWTQRPPGCADTVRTIDAEGNPSFGPR